MISASIKNSIESYLREVNNRRVKIKYHTDLQAGTFNKTCLLETSAGTYFLKHNQLNQYPKIFEKEAKGLRLLAATETVCVPEVIFYDQSSSESFILLEYIHPAEQNETFWDNFGRTMAKLHQRSNDYFGLDHDNYIGPMQQINIPHELWTDFFVEERLERLVKKARDEKMIDNSLVSNFDNLYSNLTEFFPPEPPALLHGNLWDRNYIASYHGDACVVDPSVYYGHREMDIAMTHLIDDFDERFYDTYNETAPLEEGWKERMDIYNLYPLLVLLHLGHYEYIEQINKTLKRFS